MKLSRKWGVYANAHRTLVVPQTGEIGLNMWKTNSNSRLFSRCAWVLQPVLKAIMGAALVVFAFGLVLLFTGEGWAVRGAPVIVLIGGGVLIWPDLAMPFLLRRIGYMYCTDVYAPDHVRALEAVR